MSGVHYNVQPYGCIACLVHDAEQRGPYTHGHRGVSLRQLSFMLPLYALDSVHA